MTILVISLCFLGLSVTRVTPYGERLVEPTIVTVTGTWSIEMVFESGLVLHGTLQFSCVKGILKATFKQKGTTRPKFDLPEAKLVGDRILFSFTQSAARDGTVFTIKFEGKVEEAEMGGTIDLLPFDRGTWEARKIEKP